MNKINKMDTENKYKLLIYAVILLAVMNIATFATIGYHVYKTKNKPEVNYKRQIRGNQQKYNGRYFRDRLELTPDQMVSFREINTSFRQHARSITFELIEKRKKMLVEMELEAPDRDELDLYSDSIGLLHADLKKHTYQYYMNIKQICTDLQQKELTNIFQDFFINDLHMGAPGKGQQKRHGQRGTQNNN